MKHNFWIIPANTMTKEDIKDACGKLVITGHTVRRNKFEDGKFKGLQYIEFWREDGDKNGTLSEAE